ncbi:hypothetical protein PRAC110570_04925 [Propionibacterium acidifaciens]
MSVIFATVSAAGALLALAAAVSTFLDGRR